MALYMKVSDDEYEFPIAIADSTAELARMLDKKVGTVRSAFKRVRKGEIANSTYKIIDTDEKEN